jgi:alpha-ketoglutarate-dependent taurine dioxygenase
MARIKEHFGFNCSGSVKDFTIEDRDYLITLMNRHKVLIWRNQDLSPDDLVKFSEILGPIWVNDSNGILGGNGELDRNHPDNSKITLVSNDESKGVLSDMCVPWHCDVSHKPWHTKGGTMPFRCLYGVKTASDEVSVTSWFDQEYLYDHCPSDLLEEIKDLMMVNKALYQTAWEHNIIPFILTDPITQRKSIALQKIFYNSFIGKTLQEGEDIRNRLFEIALQPENIIRHEWSVGDLVMSNSYNTAHQREKMYTKEERTLWRTTFQIPELVPLSIKPNIF